MDELCERKLVFRGVCRGWLILVILAALARGPANGGTPFFAGPAAAGFGAPAVNQFSMSAVDDGSGSIVVQPDGKLIVAGFIDELICPYDCSLPIESAYLARFHPNGTPDTTFGAGGKVFLLRQNDINGEKIADIGLQADGKIVVASTNMFGHSPFQELTVRRFNSNGTVDASFGNGGRVVIPPVAHSAFASGLAIQPDGKIVVIANEVVNEGTGSFLRVMSIIRLATNGSLDPAFNNGNGKTWVIVSPHSNAINDVVIQKDGMILVGGGWYSSGMRYLMMRILPNGTGLDREFGSNGVVISQQFGSIRDIELQPDGQILANGTNGITRIIRFKKTGAIDPTFGTGGVVQTDINFEVSSGMCLLQNGRIASVGWGSPGTRSDVAILLLNSNGSPDVTFGSNGRAIIPVGSAESAAGAIALLPDGGFVVSGNAMEGERLDSILLRYSSVRHERADFDGDGRSDPSVFRPAEGIWYANRSTEGLAATRFGLATDRITPADYDGDGKTDVAVFRDGTWWRMDSSTGTVSATAFGQPGDIPVPADYTGDGRSEYAVFRNGEWWTMDLTNGETAARSFGQTGDIPVPGDFDRDGRADHAFYRSGEWHINRSSFGPVSFPFGLATDMPVPADYDGDGRIDPAVYRDGTWHLLTETQGHRVRPWGTPTDIPVPADYDGDGKADIAIFRPSDGRWWIDRSSAGVTVIHWGLNGDLPVPRAYAD